MVTNIEISVELSGQAAQVKYRKHGQPLLAVWKYR